jgi:hypothetical protein
MTSRAEGGALSAARLALVLEIGAANSERQRLQARASGARIERMHAEETGDGLAEASARCDAAEAALAAADARLGALDAELAALDRALAEAAR